MTISPDDEPDPLHRAVRRWARAVNARDADDLIAHSHPEIDVYPMQVAVSGHYKGHDGMRRWIHDLVATDIGHQVRFVGIRTLADGRIALFGEVCVGDVVISAYSLVATVRDGKVAATRSYLSDERTMQQLKLID